MSQSDSLFVPEYVLPGTLARQALLELTRKATLLSVSGQDGETQCLSSVLSSSEANPYRLLIDQPAAIAGTKPVLAPGEPVTLLWVDGGVHYAARGRIVRIAINESTNGHPAYEIALSAEVYRQQRRRVYRVPVGPADAVHATLVLESNDAVKAVAEPLRPTVKDLSVTGCRIFVEIDKAYEYCLTERTYARLSLRLGISQQIEDLSSRTCVVREQRVGNGLLELGIAWIDPDPEFIRQIEGFVMNKQRAILKHRSGA